MPRAQLKLLLSVYFKGVIIDRKAELNQSRGYFSSHSFRHEYILLLDDIHTEYTERTVLRHPHPSATNQYSTYCP